MISYINIKNLRVKAFLPLLFLVFINISYSQTYFSKILPGWKNYSIIENDTSYVSIGMNTSWEKYPNHKNYIQVSKINKFDTSVLNYKIQIDTHTHSYGTIQIIR